MALSGMIFEQGGRRLARGAARQIAGIVLDAVAEAGGLQHLQIEVGALLQPLRFQQACPRSTSCQPLLQLLLDLMIACCSVGFGRHIVRVGEDADLVQFRFSRRSAGRIR